MQASDNEDNDDYLRQSPPFFPTPPPTPPPAEYDDVLSTTGFTLPDIFQLPEIHTQVLGLQIPEQFIWVYHLKLPDKPPIEGLEEFGDEVPPFGFDDLVDIGDFDPFMADIIEGGNEELPDEPVDLVNLHFVGKKDMVQPHPKIEPNVDDIGEIIWDHYAIVPEKQGFNEPEADQDDDGDEDENDDENDDG